MNVSEQLLHYDMVGKILPAWRVKRGQTCDDFVRSGVVSGWWNVHGTLDGAMEVARFKFVFFDEREMLAQAKGQSLFCGQESSGLLGPGERWMVAL